MKRLFSILLSALLAIPMFAQNEQSPETDPVILNRIAEWQDLKFGLMIHWGIYSQWGVVESWSICNEPWINRNGANYTDYKRDYQNLNTTFNPSHFNPKQWASIAKEAGMKYLVFTTKHHDGFCLFDTKETHYSVTDPSCPYSHNDHPDITAEVVKAFREQGLWTGLYFSKPDWHCPDYWAPEWATPDRNVNYDPQLHPERFQRYRDFTYRQIRELTHNYGDIDILWLDGGWVRPEWSINDECRDWLGCQGWVQDINMPKIATMAREENPDLIIVDRTVHGQYENYQTPEQQVPDTLLPFPWETCMSMGDSWSYVETDNYKSTNKIIHLLVDIVAKGGNYLLNIGPDAEGDFPPIAVERLQEIGQWMKINGEAIYGTRPLFPYTDGNFRFVQKANTVYAIYLLNEGENMPRQFFFSDLLKLKTGKIKVLGSKKQGKLSLSDGHYVIETPSLPTHQHAIVFELKKR